MAIMDLESKLDQLERDGYLLIEGAVPPAEVEAYRSALNRAREQGWQEGLNAVGNMWFDHLLEQDPDTFRTLIAHPGVRPYLEALMGPQCQVRRLRAHINPGPYHQEWHMDFFGFWDEVRGRYAQKAIGFNTTFYFQDNGPGLAWLKFVKGGHKAKPGGLARGLNSFDPEMERSNVVVHYQCTPFYEGAWHVSQPMGYQGTFPLAG